MYEPATREAKQSDGTESIESGLNEMTIDAVPQAEQHELILRVADRVVAWLAPLHTNTFNPPLQLRDQVGIQKKFTSNRGV